MGTSPSAAAGRAQAVRDLKRQIIREAAKGLFARGGIAGASVREIAKAAGYTTGAIYTYYDSKEEIYADILRESLDSLQLELQQAHRAGRARDRTGAALTAMFQFYVDRPHDFDLSFYLFGGARPVGLGPELNQQLNERLGSVFDELVRAFVADGLADARHARRSAIAAGASLFGLVLMMKTGRLRVLGEDPKRVLATQIEAIKAAATGPHR
jgi:AcrR family transcriptional regulator